MLMEAIGDLLPSAVGVALSPVPIIAVILMLGTPKARVNGPAFAIGWVAGLIVVSVAVLALASGASDSSSSAATGVNWVTLLLGLLFLGMAAMQWRSRPKGGEEAKLPKWMAGIDTFTPAKSLVLGAALSGVNPKNLALTVTASGAIAKADLSGSETAIAVAVFVVVGSLTVAGPVLFYVAAAAKASGPLAATKEFMANHNVIIMMVVLLILGAKLIGNGLAGVSG